LCYLKNAQSNQNGAFVNCKL